MCELILRPGVEPGIYHLTNEGKCNWAEFTATAFEFAGCDVAVIPVNRGGNYGVVRRPRYSVLENSKARALGVVLPHWRVALQRYIAGRSRADR
jgi:dTDP-4-dehydrorhamnose reductase